MLYGLEGTAHLQSQIRDVAMLWQAVLGHEDTENSGALAGCAIDKFGESLECLTDCLLAAVEMAVLI